MKIVKKTCGLILLNILLWTYSVRMTGYIPDFASLIRRWSADFEQFNAACIHWFAMRITIWLFVLWRLLWLEQRFMLYLFIRERNYMKMFVKQYVMCLIDTIFYFSIQLFVFAVQAAWYDKEVHGVLYGLVQPELWIVLVNEIFGVLNMCMFVYGLYCIIGKAETSFLLVLTARLILGCMAGGFTQYLDAGLVVNILGNAVLLAGVMYLAGRGFYDRMLGEAG